jgi:hypothetical protein
MATLSLAGLVITLSIKSYTQSFNFIQSAEYFTYYTCNPLTLS